MLSSPRIRGNPSLLTKQMREQLQNSTELLPTTGQSAHPPKVSRMSYQHLIAGLFLHYPFILGGGAGGGGGLLDGGVGLGDTPSCIFFPEGFCLEGGGFGTLTIFSTPLFIFREDSHEFDHNDFRSWNQYTFPVRILLGIPKN